MEGDPSAGGGVVPESPPPTEDADGPLDSDNAATANNNNNIITTDTMVIHVLGGGFAGLACAAALRRMANVSNVTVLEALDGPQYYETTTSSTSSDDTVGVGAVAKVTPNGFRALAAIDPTLPHRVMEAGAKLTGVAVLEQDGHTVVRILGDDPEQTSGWPQVLVRWSVLRQMLRDLIPPESIVTGVGSDVCGYVVQPETGTVQLVNEAGEPVLDSTTTTTTTTKPHLIVASDGVHSPFQSLVRMHGTILRGPDAPAIRKSNVHDNGRVNVNAVTNQAGLPELKNVPPGTALAYHAPTFTCFCAAAGQGYTSWALSVADYVDETGSRLRYFLRCSEKTPHYLPAIHQFLLELLQQHKATPLWIRELVAKTNPMALFVRRSLQLTLVGPTFVSQDAHVVLVGDAAHACSPSYGQNTSFALEDAAVLALAVRQYCSTSRRSSTVNDSISSSSNSNRLAQALHAYSDLRVHRCEEMFRRSAVRVHQQRMGQPTNDDVLSWINGWVVPYRLEEEDDENNATANES